MAGISDELARELRHAMKRPLPSGFAAAIADALHRSRGKRANQDWAQRRDAVTRIIKAGATLQTAIRRANAAYGLSPLPRGVVSSKRSRFISDAWRLVSDDLDHVVDDVLRPWLTMHAPRRTRRGNPHTGRFEVRIDVLRALDDAGLPISKNAQGLAANVLRAVLEEADRLSGNTSRFRANFNGSQWAYWVAQYQYIKTMVDEDVGLNARAIEDWVNTNPLPPPPRSGK